jgi:hypothetical protein
MIVQKLMQMPVTIHCIASLNASSNASLNSSSNASLNASSNANLNVSSNVGFNASSNTIAKASQKKCFKMLALMIKIMLFPKLLQFQITIQNAVSNASASLRNRLK